MSRTEATAYGLRGRLNGRASNGASRAASRRMRPGVAARVVPRALATVLVVAGLAGLAGHRRPEPNVALVMDASVANDPALRAEAETWLRGAAPPGAARIAARVPAGATQQLSVTSTLATRGYDTIVAIGLDSRVALDPVVRRYPDLRVVRWPGVN